MGYLFGIGPYVFSKIQATVQDFWLMQMDLCPDLKLSMGKYARFFLAEV